MSSNDSCVNECFLTDTLTISQSDDQYVKQTSNDSFNVSTNDSTSECLLNNSNNELTPIQHSEAMTQLHNFKDIMSELDGLLYYYTHTTPRLRHLLHNVTIYNIDRLMILPILETKKIINNIRSEYAKAFAHLLLIKAETFITNIQNILART